MKDERSHLSSFTRVFPWTDSSFIVCFRERVHLSRKHTVKDEPIHLILHSFYRVHVKEFTAIRSLSRPFAACVFLWIDSPVNRFTVCLRPEGVNKLAVFLWLTNHAQQTANSREPNSINFAHCGSSRQIAFHRSDFTNLDLYQHSEPVLQLSESRPFLAKPVSRIWKY